MKYLLIISYLLFSNIVFTQSTIEKYYDSNWNPSTKEKAKYFQQITKKQSVYNSITYSLPSMNLHSRTTYSDSTFEKEIGIICRYYESGKIKDSAFITPDRKMIFNYRFYETGKLKDSTKQDENGEMVEHFYYYESGNLFVHNINYRKPNQITEAFSENGEKISNFIYSKPPEYAGGLNGWQSFIVKHLNTNIPTKKGAPPGIYTVIVRFTIDENGYVINVHAENDPGYGTKEEALRVFSKSPKWRPAILLNKTAPYNHRQSISFQVSDEK